MLSSLISTQLPNSDMTVGDALMSAAIGHDPAAEALAEVGISCADCRLSLDFANPGLIALVVLALTNEEPGATCHAPTFTRVSLPFYVEA